MNSQKPKTLFIQQLSSGYINGGKFMNEILPISEKEQTAWMKPRGIMVSQAPKRNHCTIAFIWSSSTGESQSVKELWIEVALQRVTVWEGAWKRLPGGLETLIWVVVTWLCIYSYSYKPQFHVCNVRSQFLRRLQDLRPLSLSQPPCPHP